MKSILTLGHINKSPQQLNQLTKNDLIEFYQQALNELTYKNLIPPGSRVVKDKDIKYLKNSLESSLEKINKLESSLEDQGQELQEAYHTLSRKNEYITELKDDKNKLENRLYNANHFIDLLHIREQNLYNKLCYDQGYKPLLGFFEGSYF